MWWVGLWKSVGEYKVRGCVLFWNGAERGGWCRIHGVELGPDSIHVTFD